jgi:hypothetical protein
VRRGVLRFAGGVSLGAVDARGPAAAGFRIDEEHPAVAADPRRTSRTSW